MTAETDFQWDEAAPPDQTAKHSVKLPFRQRGGVRVSGSMLASFSASWPFSTIAVDKGVVELRTIGFPSYEFRSGPSVRFTNHSGLFSKGVRFRDDDDISATDIIFWTFDRPTLKSALRKAGFRSE